MLLMPLKQGKKVGKNSEENRFFLPGSFLGLRIGTNLAPMASAIGGPNMNPRDSIPVCQNTASHY